LTAGWHHLAFVSWWSTVFRFGVVAVFIDGTLADTCGGWKSGDAISGWVIGRDPSNLVRYWENDIDDFAVFFATAKYTSNFSPHRYEQGYVTLSKTAEATQHSVTAIDWTGTFGSSYGTLYQVQVNTGTDASPIWTTVGGSNPTSPITGLSIPVQAGVTKWLRVYLAPKADTLQSETPTLNAIRVTHVAPGAHLRSRQPIHLGPSLLPLGGIF